MNYGQLVTSVDDDPATTGVNESVSHSWWDTDSMLQPGVVYSYRIEAFTDAATALMSDAVSAKVYQPFTASLVGPANRGSAGFGIDGYGDPYGPAYSFSISNTALWNATESDFFYFALTVNEKSGPYAYYGKYRYNFALTRFEYLNAFSGAWSNGGTNGQLFVYDNGTITFNWGGYVAYMGSSNLVSGTSIEYKDAVTYEWDIIGDLSGGHPCWFEKAYAGGVSKSYGDAYSEGANTLNGRFELTAVAE